LGVDIGGSHLSCALIDHTHGSFVSEKRIRKSYNHQADADSIINEWATAINSGLILLPKDSVLKGIAFAIPGPFDYPNGISKMEHKMASLYNKHIPSALQNQLNSNKEIEMRFCNDATCFAMGESIIDQKGVQKKVIAITLGTGFGAAFLDNQIPVVERADVPNGGCLWNLTFKNGIADEYFSTNWFIEAFKNYSKHDSISGVKDLLSRSPEIVKIIFDQFGNNLGTFLSPYIKKFNADLLIIGGNISKAFYQFKDPLTNSFRTQDININIQSSTLLEDAALMGSAQLFNDVHWKAISKVLPKI